MFKKRKSGSAPQSIPSAQLDSEAAAFPPIGTTLPHSYYQYPGGAGATAGAAQAARPVVMPRRRSWKTVLKRFTQAVLILGLLAGIFVGVKFLINTGKAFNGNLFGLLQNEQLKGEDTGRVNILVAGNSADDPGHSGGELTDSIMLLSIDTKNNRAFMMSIPRDLWVDSPTDGYTKINAVYKYGKDDNFTSAGYPGGGMGALEKVVSENLGIDIHYYALINYTAFRQAVDAVGGIDVNIQSSDPRGLYDPSRDWTKSYRAPLVKLTNGVHHLDGQEALNLARARGDTYGAYGYAQSDYTRTANQRLMLVSLKDKAASAGVALNPIKIASLLDSFGSNVTTDFKTTEVRRLFDLSKKVPSSNITSVGLNDVNGKSLLASYRAPGGQSALIPALGRDNYSAIQAYITQLTTPPPPAAPANQ
jgi:LCP family protein required for cell wall assembly